MLVLYDLAISSYGCKTRILLRHKGLEWTSLAPPDGYGSPTYCKIVPSGTIPALVHDGFTLGESDAIAEYLNELAPNLQCFLNPSKNAQWHAPCHGFTTLALNRYFAPILGRLSQQSAMPISLPRMPPFCSAAFTSLPRSGRHHRF